MRKSVSVVVAIVAFVAFAAFAQTRVRQPARRAAPAGIVRTYYIAADEVRWNYAPGGRHLTGAPTAESEEDSTAPIEYLKAIYREYTDDTFTVLKPRPPAWEHLGILGPLIRAEVGDTVKVVFRNKTNGFYSIHPHGFAYAKDSEGALYDDGTTEAEKRDDVLAPGKTHTYTWNVPERAGPAHGDGSTVLWMYHSHFLTPIDMNTGLLGPIIVGRKGSLRPDGTPTDVDREFVVALAIFDETQSSYTEANLMKDPSRPNLPKTDPAFRQRYLMYTMNGFIDGNLPMPTMKVGERVRWYLLSNSNEEDIHAAHWHGATAVSMHMRTDTVPLLPAAMAVADMVPDMPGMWLFHCHVNEHLERGMIARFKVEP